MIPNLTLKIVSEILKLNVRITFIPNRFPHRVDWKLLLGH